LLYPSFSIAGIIIAPIEEISATADPETPPKNIEARMLIWANPPGIRPTITSAIFTRRVEIPPRAISTPAKMNRITANNGNEFMAVIIRWTIVVLSTSHIVIPATTEPIPIAKDIGIFINNNIRKIPIAKAMVIVCSLSKIEQGENTFQFLTNYKKNN
jgi:hypothetical protein